MRMLVYRGKNAKSIRFREGYHGLRGNIKKKMSFGRALVGVPFPRLDSLRGIGIGAGDTSALLGDGHVFGELIGCVEVVGAPHERLSDGIG